MVFLYCGQGLIQCGMRRSPSLHSFLSSVYCDLLCMTRTHLVMISLVSILYHWRVLRKVNNIVCVCVCVRVCVHACVWESVHIWVFFFGWWQVIVMSTCTLQVGRRLKTPPSSYTSPSMRHTISASRYARWTMLLCLCIHMYMCACTPAYVICVLNFLIYCSEIDQ